jgi:hypothetical protein
MISKLEILESIAHETQIIKHIAGKLSEADLAYRPSEKQRSMLDLLQYLTCCSSVPATFIANDNWDAAERLSSASADVNLSNFATAMDAQLSFLHETFLNFDDQALSQKDSSMPWGKAVKAGAAIVSMCLSTLVAYRMQLFLYAKAAGLIELNRYDCWAGTDG